VRGRRGHGAPHLYCPPRGRAGVIARVPVESSHLASVGHDGGAMLETELTDGSVYDYHGVPRDVCLGLLGAGSKGKHLGAHARGKLAYEGVV